MHRLLYYPNFEIKDENFLKFALLYVDEISIIVPQGAHNLLSESTLNIMNNTQLFKTCSPSFDGGRLAATAAIEYLEKVKILDRYRQDSVGRNVPTSNTTLYVGKYAYEFEQYCVENKLGERCNDGLLLREDVAYSYMSILANIISKETETDMITDDERYSDPVLRKMENTRQDGMDRLNIIRREIEFHVPCDMRKIPIEKFINLRSDYRFETARLYFVDELNHILDSCDVSNDRVDLRGLMECKKEIYGLLKDAFISCAAMTVGVGSLRKIISSDGGALDFWTNIGNLGINLETIGQHIWKAKDYLTQIEGKRQARRYLACIEQIRPERL